MSIILWILTQILESLWNVYRKKAVDSSKLWKNLFAIVWPITWALIVYTLIAFNWSDFSIFSDNKTILLMLLIWLIGTVANYIYIYVYKNVKISTLLPYDNLDSLFVILIWFFIFTWTQAETSITTLIIAIFTVLLIMWFSFNLKNFKISKEIGLYIIALILEASTTLITWYLLLKYSTLDFMSLNSFIIFILYFILAILYRESFKSITKQSKTFYKSRWLSLILWWTWFLIGLYIIETAWVLIATLISFIWILTSVLSLKYVLKDSPEKKDVILAIIVTFMIWLWYYFK